MKVISLNVWGGRLYDRLEPFIMEKSKSTDIFLFQEHLSEPRTIPPEISMVLDRYANHGSLVFDLHQRMQQLLPDFTGMASFEYADFGSRLGLFYRRSIGADDYGDEAILAPVRQDIGGGAITTQGVRMQWIRAGGLTVAHFHGAWIKGVYGDCPERREQSEKVLSILERIGGRSAVLGDMNLRPDSEGVKILSGSMRNLIAERGIANTRSPTFSFAGSKPMVTDYAFVSPDVTVKEFGALPDEVSDHLPLYLEIR